MEDIFKFSNYFNSLGIFSNLFDPNKNVWEGLSKMDQIFEEFRQNLPEGYSFLNEKVIVGQNVKIEEFSKIDGTAVIGSNSTIGHAAYLRGNVLIGENVNIGHSAEVKHSVILNNSAVAHLNYIGDSIVGENVNVAGGTIFANFRLDKRPVSIKIDDRRVETNLEKFGSIIGDNVQIGASSVLNPGTVIGRDSIIFPLTSVSGYHPQNSKIKE